MKLKASIQAFYIINAALAATYVRPKTIPVGWDQSTRLFGEPTKECQSDTCTYTYTLYTPYKTSLKTTTVTKLWAGDTTSTLIYTTQSTKDGTLYRIEEDDIYVPETPVTTVTSTKPWGQDYTSTLIYTTHTTIDGTTHRIEEDDIYVPALFSTSSRQLSSSSASALFSTSSRQLSSSSASALFSTSSRQLSSSSAPALFSTSLRPYYMNSSDARSVSKTFIPEGSKVTLVSLPITSVLVVISKSPLQTSFNSIHFSAGSTIASTSYAASTISSQSLRLPQESSLSPSITQAASSTYSLYSPSIDTYEGSAPHFSGFKWLYLLFCLICIF